MEKILKSTGGDETENSRTMRQVLTLGVNKRLVLLMQRIIFKQGTLVRLLLCPLLHVARERLEGLRTTLHKR